MKKIIHKHTYIKFIGKFTDLKRMGYKFQKLFANNYMQWCKHVDPEGYGHCIRVWKLGCEVEFDDLYDRSYLVLDAIRTNNMVKKEFNGGTWYDFAINKKDCTIFPRDYKIHSEMAYMKKAGLEKEYSNPEKNPKDVEEKIGKVLKEYYDTWREYHITPEFIAMIKEFDSMMEIVKVKEID